MRGGNSYRGSACPGAGVNKPETESNRAVLLSTAKQKRVIAIHSRELAAQITNEIDKRVFIARADELDQEAAELEAEAAKLPEAP